MHTLCSPPHMHSLLSHSPHATPFSHTTPHMSLFLYQRKPSSHSRPTPHSPHHYVTPHHHSTPLHRSQGHRPVMDHSRICRRRGRRYASDPQSEICRHKPQLVPVILEGAQMAMQECQSQFAGQRWNCSDNKRSLKRILMRGEVLGVG